MNNMFRVRCLVALYWNAPEAMDALISNVPGSPKTVSIPRYHKVPATLRRFIPEPEKLLTTEVDHLPVENLLFRRPPGARHYDHQLVSVKAAYDERENTIYLVEAEAS